LIWIKRVIPIVMIGLTIGGYISYRDHIQKNYDELTQNRAEVTARVWFTATRFRNEPETYISFRDSLLAEARITREQMQQYLDMYNKEPEKYEKFAQWVNYYIDSLCDLRESYRSGRNKLDTLPDNSTSKTP